MANTYDVPDLVRLTVTVTDADDAADDPTALVILVKKTDGTYVGYGSSSGWSDQGNWDASANDPELADGTGTAGDYYTVTAAGSVDFGNGSISFEVGDRVFYNGYQWRRWHAPSATALTNSATGVYYVDHPVSGSDVDGPVDKVVWRGETVGVGKVAGGESWFNVSVPEVF